MIQRQSSKDLRAHQMSHTQDQWGKNMLNMPSGKGLHSRVRIPQSNMNILSKKLKEWNQQKADNTASLDSSLVVGPRRIDDTTSN